jgi:hypothetical protein
MYLLLETVENACFPLLLKLVKSREEKYNTGAERACFPLSFDMELQKRFMSLSCNR